MKEPLSVRNDFVFRYLFGNQKNEHILRSFLQSVLDLPKEEYQSLTIIDPHLQREFEEDKLGILDVKVHTKSGNVVEVEVQVQDIPRMRNRILFYISKMVTEQIQKGEGYEVLKKAVSIVITDYIMLEEIAAYHNRFQFYDKDSGALFSDMMEIDTLELPKIPKIPEDTPLYDWMLFFNARGREDLNMAAERNVDVRKAAENLMEISQDERVRREAEIHEKNRRDYWARIDGAYDKGRAEGIAEGKAEGETEKAREIARNALKFSMPIDQIVQLTGLTAEEIEKLNK